MCIRDSYYGHLHIVKYLVSDFSCNPSVDGLYGQLTPLHFACMAVCSKETALDIIKYLIKECNSDYDLPTINGDSPLMVLLSTKSEWNSVVQHLVCDCTCDLSQKNTRGETALHIACAKENSEAVKMIVETGVDPNVEDEAGNTPLHLSLIHI